jgi:hypothetical protein
MPGAPPAAKPEADTTELMKGFHGIFKAMDKMVEMSDKLAPGFAEAKKALKKAAADALGAGASSLDDSSDSSSATPPPAGTPPPPDAGAGAPPPAGPTS